MKVFKGTILLAVTVLVVVCGTALSQQNGMAKPVKWEGIAGKNKEFIVYMPKGYIPTSQENFYVGNGPSYAKALVKKCAKAARLINGIVLMTEYYEGDASDIEKALTDGNDLTKIKEDDRNGFHITSFSKVKAPMTEKYQFFRTNKELYVLTTISRNANDKIVKAFFESVRLFEDGKGVAPNVPDGITESTLPTIKEIEPLKSGDDEAVELGKPLDRNIIILSWVPLIRGGDDRHGISSFTMTLEVIYSSSGKITAAKRIEGPNVLAKKAIERARQAVFIPAEKDGRLVSVKKKIVFSYETSTRIN
jgi:hypothetical protein